MSHAIVDQLQPSMEQRQAIEADGGPLMVVAGAGAGKTRTLVARYLRLLAEGAPLRKVVAITFTKKAAREMRNRVRQEMRRYLESLPPGAQRAQWEQLYGDLDAARIGTIHSLCTDILRSQPVQADIDPAAEVLAEGQGNILRSQAVDAALAWAADDVGAARLFALLGERNLRKTVDTLLARRLDAVAAFLPPGADIYALWQEALESSQEQALEAALARPTWREAVAALEEHVARVPGDFLEGERRRVLAAVQTPRRPRGDWLRGHAGLAEIKLTAGSRKAWQGGADEWNLIKNALRTVREPWQEPKKNVLCWALGDLDRRLADALPDLQRTFESASAAYARLKRDRNALDFDDLEDKAVALLRTPAVCARWQQQVAAVLVDEFQDTNARQAELVHLLCGDNGLAAGGDGHKLFLVGDGKQSIYRFRGADVAVFRAEEQRTRSYGQVHDLEESYRSHAALMTGLNALLAPVLGEADDPARPWLEPFKAIKAMRAQPASGVPSPCIELHLAFGTRKDGALDRAAAALAARLRELVDGRTICISRGGRAQALDFDDIAILCRGASSFPAYEDALEAARIPFVTVAGRGFYNRPEVRDVLNALRAVADPGDDVALLGLLRSPAFGLSDGALYTICATRPTASSPAVGLWQHLPAAIGLDAAGAGQLQWAISTIAGLSRRAGRVPVADLLKAFLDSTDYRAALLKAGQQRAARNVSKLLADAQDSGIVSVGEFVEYVQKLRDSDAREGEARALADGALQIMSVHQAKGLEFPIVVLGDATSERRAGGDGLLLDRTVGVVLSLKDKDNKEEKCAAFKLAARTANDRDAAEGDRLLYVAATRAREMLIINGCLESPAATPDGWLGRFCETEALALQPALLGCPYQDDGNAVHELAVQAGGSKIDCRVYEPSWQPPAVPAVSRQTMPAASVPPPLLDPIVAVEQAPDEGIERQIVPAPRVWRVAPAAKRPEAPAWVIGSLVHEALAAWRFPGPGFTEWLRARAASYGMTDKKQTANAVRETARLLERFRRHPLYGSMSAAARRFHEVPYSIMVNNRPDSRIIDALYEQSGVWTIVEFKTDRVANEQELAALIREKDYRQQAQRYVDAATRFIGERPRHLLCLLNYKGGVLVKDDLLAATPPAG